MSPSITRYRHILSNPSRMAGLVGGMGASEIVKVLQLFAKARIHHDTLLSKIAHRLQANVRELPPSDIVKAVYGLGKFRYAEDNGKVLGIISSQARRNLHAYSMDDCAQLVSSLSRCRVKNKPLVDAIVARLVTGGITGEVSVRCVSNLMVGLARCGTRIEDKGSVWSLLADQLSGLLGSACKNGSSNSSTLHDGLSGLLAYSYCNPGQSPHSGLFSQVSLLMAQHSAELEFDHIVSYLKSCSRVQYRDMAALGSVGKTIRLNHLSTVASLETKKLLELYNCLDKLGVEMSEVIEELRTRDDGVKVESKVGSVWFKRGVFFAQTNEKSKKLQQSHAFTGKSIRSRKWTW